MKQVTFIIYLFFLTIIFHCCSLDDTYHNLHDGYFLYGNSKNTLNLCRNIKDANSTIKEDVVLGEIIDYDFNDNFILVYQNIKNREYSYFNSVSKDDSLWQASLKLNIDLQYWIIVKSSGLIIGPLNEQSYFSERSKLKIPQDLKLKTKI